MYVRPRARFRPRNAGGAPFSPAMLFTGGTVGAWYDPSDYTTLFQDSSGTTPVTAVEQPVRLMLDKSQGLVLGSELVTTTSMVAQNANGTVTVVGSTLVATCTVNGLYGARFSPAPGVVIGSNYFVTVTISTNSASKAVLMDFGGYSSRTITSTTGSQTFRLSAVSGTTISIYVASGVAGESFTISLISVRELPGNHALAPNDASRPVLRARYNLLTYSEQFNNAVWTSSAVNATATADQATAPNGTVTADLMQATAAGANAFLIANPGVTSGVTYTTSIYVKRVNADWFALSNSAYFAYFNLSSGTVGSVGEGSATITDVGSGWWRIVWSGQTNVSTAIRIRAVTANNNQNVSGGEQYYIWGADLRTGSSAGTYQRIAAATDYATAGFLPYLYFVTDDSFGTNSINFTATDKMSVCAGVTKLSDAAIGVLVELSTSSSSNLGTFGVFAPGSVAAEYTFQCSGSSLAARRATTYTSPTTNVLFVAFDNAQSTTDTEIVPRINGATPTLTNIIGPAGTGNFTNTALYIGRRNNATLPFNGNFYQLVVVGKTLSAAELASTEAYVATKTGVTL